MKSSRWGMSLALALAACSSPTVPDFTWYRLPPPAQLAHSAAPLTGAVVVEAFSADGLYADQALVHADDPSARQLRQYHYQLWVDPPVRLLQRRLIAQLRQSGLAREVSDDLPASSQPLRISGVILHLDRVPQLDGGWKAEVVLKLRAEAGDGATLVDAVYRDAQPADTVELKSSVDAFGAAIDRIFARFHAELVEHLDGRHAH